MLSNSLHAAPKGVAMLEDYTDGLKERMNAYDLKQRQQINGQPLCPQCGHRLDSDLEPQEGTAQDSSSKEMITLAQGA